jgi:sugar phosphate isomerase/epimerase
MVLFVFTSDNMKLPIYNKPVLTADKIEELKREIAIASVNRRERVFPEWSSGPSPKLKPEVASKRRFADAIAILNEILKDYEAILAKQGIQSQLF